MRCTSGILGVRLQATNKAVHSNQQPLTRSLIPVINNINKQLNLHFSNEV